MTVEAVAMLRNEALPPALVEQKLLVAHNIKPKTAAETVAHALELSGFIDQNGKINQQAIAVAFALERLKQVEINLNNTDKQIGELNTRILAKDTESTTRNPENKQFSFFDGVPMQGMKNIQPNPEYIPEEKKMALQVKLVEVKLKLEAMRMQWVKQISELLGLITHKYEISLPNGAEPAAAQPATAPNKFAPIIYSVHTRTQSHPQTLFPEDGSSNATH